MMTIDDQVRSRISDGTSGGIYALQIVRALAVQLCDANPLDARLDVLREVLALQSASPGVGMISSDSDLRMASEAISKAREVGETLSDPI